MSERGRADSNRRWLSWSLPEGRKALRRFVATQEDATARLILGALDAEEDPFYRHGFATGWVLAEPDGSGVPLAFLWAGFDEFEVQRRRRPLGLFDLRLQPGAALRTESAPNARELRAGMEQVVRFLRSRAVTDAVGPVHLGFHRDFDWGVRAEKSEDAGLVRAFRTLGCPSERVARRIRIAVRQLVSTPGFLADVELARHGGKVSLRPLARRPLWREPGGILDPLKRVESGEWSLLSELAQASVWDVGFTEAVGPSPMEWLQIARQCGPRSFLKWSQWLEVAGEIAGFVFAWEDGDTIRIRRIALDARYRDFHLAPYALREIADRALAERRDFVEIGPVPAGPGPWSDLLAGFCGDAGGAVLVDEAVDLFSFEV